MIIGITGTNGSGKGTVAEILGEKGFESHSLSDELRRELKKRGIEENRDSLIAIGNELREKEGPATLSRRILKTIDSGKSRNRDFVVDSIRNPAEIDELRKNKSFILIAVDAPMELRYRRAKARGREGDFISFGKFREQEEVQLRGSATGQQLLKCMSLADFRITNEGSMEGLKGKVDSILAKYSKQK